MRADRQPAPLLHRTVHATAADPEFPGYFAPLASSASTSPAFAIRCPGALYESFTRKISKELGLPRWSGFATC